MSDIPSELHREILLRLPAESLFRFRSVCKSWRRIIDDPPFLRSITTTNQLPFPNLLISSGTNSLYSLSLDSLIHINCDQTIDATHVKYSPWLEFPAATCNGLILILDHQYYDTWEYDEIFVILNPLTGDFHELPKLDVDLGFAGCGIGYDSASDDYIVVRLDYLKNVYRTLVYSLRLNTWKQIMDCPDFYNGNSMNENVGVFLNGAIHWKTYSSIVVLDLATEKYHELAAPPEHEYPWFTRLDAFDGCLVVSVVSGTKRSWMMKDDRWVRLYSSVERGVIGGYTSRQMRMCPIAYSEKERRLILQQENEIVVWDIEKKFAKKITIHGLLGNRSSYQICPRSIFRFNGIVGGVKRNINEDSTRLKLSVTTTTDSPYLYESDSSSDEDLI
ncbi:hypothetical protein CASFOL_029917 [Castilleja foliolosa]|uniref:F-box domain-containing protein n=1 Tax=Castilleja foliolosa TaxID=1961234 RepID=A0ABD3C958_9LAMI